MFPDTPHTSRNLRESRPHITAVKGTITFYIVLDDPCTRSRRGHTAFRANYPSDHRSSGMGDDKRFRSRPEDQSVMSDVYSWFDNYTAEHTRSTVVLVLVPVADVEYRQHTCNSVPGRSRKTSHVQFPGIPVLKTQKP